MEQVQVQGVWVAEHQGRLAIKVFNNLLAETLANANKEAAPGARQHRGSTLSARNTAHPRE